MATRRHFIASVAARPRPGWRRPARRPGRRLAVAPRARDLADRDRRTGAEFPLVRRRLKDTFGQNFVLENMPGGSGSVGCMAVARSAPDGHTLLLASNSHIVLAPLVLTGSPVNVKRDFAPIALMFTFPFLLVVNAELGPKTLKELVDYAKARPGQLNWGSPGVGTGGHLVTELLLKRTGIQGQHIPYPGTTQQLAAAARHVAVHLRHARQFEGRARRRQGDRAGGDRQRSVRSRRPRCRPSASWATMASTISTSPTACWPRLERRRASSRRSTARS